MQRRRLGLGPGPGLGPAAVNVNVSQSSPPHYQRQASAAGAAAGTVTGPASASATDSGGSRSGSSVRVRGHQYTQYSRGRDLAKMICFQLLLVVAALCYSYAHLSSNDIREASIPIVINTWDFTNATTTAWDILASGGSALDAVEKGCAQCELDQCGGTVGYGGSPDENGETTLDALIMDGNSMDVGGVGALRGIRHAAAVARAVLEHTGHSLLVGDQATDFALQMGFQKEPMATNRSQDIQNKWKQNKCQPNYWKDVSPDPQQSCGPYKALESSAQSTFSASEISDTNHDTIGMIAIDNEGRIVAGTSTNGLAHKIPGRVGDSPIPGSGAYADSTVGAAAGTGDGDIMMRFVPSFLAVEEMRRGANPTDAATTAIRRMITHYPNFSGAVIAVSKTGEYGAACHNIPKFQDTFPFCVHRGEQSLRQERVHCI